jgi:hypothetical protein
MPVPKDFRNVYDLEYFSGAQMNMYIGDVLIDEVTSLQIQVQQRKMPVYGYASQLFDKVAKGTVFVEGTFTINYKESGYLYAVLERYRTLINGGHRGTPSPFMSAAGFSQIEKNRTGGAINGGKPGFLTRLNIERMNETVDQVLNGKTPDGSNIRPEDLIEYYRSMTGFNNPGFPTQKAAEDDLQRGAPGGANAAEKTMEIFEDKVWGSKRLDEDSEGRRGDSNHFDNFTIYVTMGDYNRNDRVNHTVKRIDNVHLIGQAQTIVINGEPVAEQYSFFARNFV